MLQPRMATVGALPHASGVIRFTVTGMFAEGERVAVEAESEGMHVSVLALARN
jgi:hypothetical protein